MDPTAMSAATTLHAATLGGAKVLGAEKPDRQSGAGQES